MSCHGSQGEAAGLVERGLLAPDAQPTLLSATLSLSSAHPLTEGAYSRREDGAVTCTSCHSPHRGGQRTQRRTESAEPKIAESSGQKRVSQRDPTRFEYEMCQACHGSQGMRTQDLRDISRLTDPATTSYHPIQTSTNERSPSIRPELSGGEINCTDCHGNSDVNGPRGPHGSAVPYLLRANYTVSDGATEMQVVAENSVYELCFECHDRQRLFEESPFPQHRSHVLGLGASCSTCHNPHGSADNRALIRYGEEVFVAGVSPSLSTGQLAFVSDSQGSGSCYLSCHGVDHAPRSYGAAPLLPTSLDPLLGDTASWGVPPPIPDLGAPIPLDAGAPEKRPEKQ